MAESITQLEEQLYNNRIAYGRAIMTMDQSKVGSDSYKQAKKTFDIAKKAIADLEKKIADMKSASKKADTDKKTADKLKSLQDKRQRLVDQGKSTLDIDKEIKKLQPTPTPTPTPTPSVGGVAMGDRPFGGQNIINPTVAGDQTVTDETVVNPDGKKKIVSTGGDKTYKGTGTKQDPLTLNGKPFSGSYNGKKYTNGVVATTAEETGTGLTAKQEATLGTYGSKYLLEYFKINYPKIYNDLLKFAQVNESPTNVEGYLRNTAWYTDVNQRVKATIGGFALANGLTLNADQETQFRDQILSKVKDREEIQYQIRLLAIDKFQLETTKPDIARAMKAGLDFNQAASDYIQIYRENFNIAISQFSVNDTMFQTLLTKSSNIADFTKQLRRTDKYLSQPQVQQQLNANKLMITTKYRQYGLSITEEAASNLAKNVFLGDSNNEQIDENLRQQAVAAFPAFRDRILNGESPLAIASPYIQAMVRILEIPEGGLDLEDPTIRRAMQGKAIADAKGNTTSYETVPLWMFEQSLYKDNRWQFTANARNKADTITLQLKDMLGL
jgi:hypothetical protein